MSDESLDATGRAPTTEAARAGVPRRPGEPAEDDWLSFGGDAFEPGSLSPLRERDDGPAGPPTPGEARNFAKEARRRASRRPSSILDFDEERARLEQADSEDQAEDVDFESVLATQPQKGRRRTPRFRLPERLRARCPEPPPRRQRAARGEP